MDAGSGLVIGTEIGLLDLINGPQTKGVLHGLGSKISELFDEFSYVLGDNEVEQEQFLHSMHLGRFVVVVNLFSAKVGVSDCGVLENNRKSFVDDCICLVGNRKFVWQNGHKTLGCV